MMTIKQFLLDSQDQEELTSKLEVLDANLLAFHNSGRYFIGFDTDKIMIDNNRIQLPSVGKWDYLNSGYNFAGDKKDILELCAIGICAYAKFNAFYTNKEYLNYLMSNLNLFKNRIPEEMFSYYEDVLINNNIDYLINYIKKTKEQETGNTNQRVYRKSLSTEIGRAFASDNDKAAFVNVLLIPSILALLYIGFLVFNMLISK